MADETLTRDVTDEKVLLWDEAVAQAALDALESGQPFEEVAKRYSDGPMGIRGGDLGLFMEGELGPAGVEVLRAVKHALDPGDRFNPGNLLPG